MAFIDDMREERLLQELALLQTQANPPRSAESLDYSLPELLFHLGGVEPQIPPSSQRALAAYDEWRSQPEFQALALRNSPKIRALQTFVARPPARSLSMGTSGGVTPGSSEDVLVTTPSASLPLPVSVQPSEKRGYGISGSWEAPSPPQSVSVGRPDALQQTGKKRGLFTDTLALLASLLSRRSNPKTVPPAKLPEIPESANRRAVTALVEQAVKELFPGVRMRTIHGDEVMQDAVKQRVKELYWSSVKQSGPRVEFFNPIQAP